MLTFLVGSHVPLNILYHLGRKKPDASSAQRPRPVLLTFSSMDWKMVLSCVRKLKTYSITGLYLRPDLTVEERMKRKSVNSNMSTNVPLTVPAPSNSASSCSAGVSDTPANS